MLLIGINDENYFYLFTFFILFYLFSTFVCDLINFQCLTYNFEINKIFFFLIVRTNMCSMTIDQRDAENIRKLHVKNIENLSSCMNFLSNLLE